MTELEIKYRQRQPILAKIAANLEDYLREILAHEAHIDRVAARAKTVDSFMTKALSKNESGTTKYNEPLYEIQDQVGGRVIVLYRSDLTRIQQRVSEYFGSIEEKRREPESASEFGYEGHHFILMLPEEAFRDAPRTNAPQVFELQIKTLYQHAWSEASHDIVYKGADLNFEQRRRAAYAAAQSWGADQVFEGLYDDIARNTTAH